MRICIESGSSAGQIHECQSKPGILRNGLRVVLDGARDAPAGRGCARQQRLEAQGYEASFLALEGNPLIDWQATQKIRLRFKQGLLLP